ncbi:MAG: hypothetical protein ACRD0W_24600 [Acidimicrobiales bacterium]
MTPLVLLAAREAGAHEQVVIYQSGWFEDAIKPETWRLAEEGYGTIVMVDRVYTAG